MKIPIAIALRLATLALTGAMVAGPACAQLGGTASAPPSARAFAQTTTSLFNGAAVRRTYIDAGGTTINEYASSTGQIFAYTWSGPTSPDLRQLLGTHFSDYQAGVATAHENAGLHGGRVVQPGFVVEAGGRMRGYTGRAWMPAALPPGVSIDDLQ